MAGDFVSGQGADAAAKVQSEWKAGGAQVSVEQAQQIAREFAGAKGADVAKALDAAEGIWRQALKDGAPADFAHAIAEGQKPNPQARSAKAMMSILQNYLTDRSQGIERSSKDP